MNEESKEKNKIVELRAESELPIDEGNELLESIALLSKNFERVIKRLNAQSKGISQTRKETRIKNVNPLL